MDTEFDWDDAKNAANIAARGIDFGIAVRIDWSQALIGTDDRVDYGEDRIQVVAPIDGRLHILIYVLRSGRMRIISLRKANKRERRRYADRMDGSL